MATYNEFKDAIDDLLGLAAARQVLQLNSPKIEKAFEIYVLSLVAEAIKNAGGHSTITGINSGSNPRPVVFRANPGSIHSTKKDFAYLNCSLNKKEFELHVDVEFEGTSGATHEIDVSLIEHHHASRSREAKRNPKYPVFIVECKFFSKSRPSTGLARALVGLVSDITKKPFSVFFISNDATDNLKKYLSKPKGTCPFTDLNRETEQRFINFIETKLKQWEFA